MDVKNSDELQKKLIRDSRRYNELMNFLEKLLDKDLIENKLKESKNKDRAKNLDDDKY